jgi:hypothetical protein
MRNLNFAQLSVIAIFVSGCSAEVIQPPKDTLQPLKDFNVVDADTMSVEITGYKPKAGYEFKNIFVSNFYVRNEKGKLLPSTSWDGMTDEFKNSLSTSYGFKDQGPQSRAFPEKGYSDLVLFLSGIVRAQQRFAFCPINQVNSFSRDAFEFVDNIYNTNSGRSVFLGLRDCEKQYLGLDFKDFDFDQDGIPDYLELRCGLNPKNPNDAANSPAGDGVSNIDKCKMNIPIDESAQVGTNFKFAYKYDVELLQDGSGTRNFRVKNIAILNGGRGNFLAYYIVESSTSTGKSRITTAYTRLKDGMANANFSFPYWVTPLLSSETNREIPVP